ncbi:MAG: lipocalin-like domain-containing protein [Pyrinomonadaceae bacterium]
MGEQNTIQDNIQDFLKSFENNASDFLEGVAETFLGKADTLRDGTELEPVNLPRDLYAHRNAQTEWWYYTGHGETSSGKQFGFELVFFKRRTDLDKFSLVPLRLFGNPIYFAHFALTDCDGKKFRYSHRKSANGFLICRHRQVKIIFICASATGLCANRTTRTFCARQSAAILFSKRR